MKAVLVAATIVAFAAITPTAYAGEAKTTGLVGGVVAGAIVGGPVGAVVGGAVGLTAGTLVEKDQRHHRYIKRHHRTR